MKMIAKLKGQEQAALALETLGTLESIFSNMEAIHELTGTITITFGEQEIEPEKDDRETCEQN